MERGHPVAQHEVSTGSDSDRVSTSHTIEIARKGPGRYRSRY